MVAAFLFNLNTASGIDQAFAARAKSIYLSQQPLGDTAWLYFTNIVESIVKKDVANRSQNTPWRYSF